MVIKSKENSVGAWAFLIGVILAIIIGIATSTLLPIPSIAAYSSTIFGLLVVLGLVVGFMNVRAKDSQTFMLAGAILVVVSGFGMDSVTGSLIGFPIAEPVRTVFSALLALFVPATIIVALKTVFSIAKV